MVLPLELEVLVEGWPTLVWCPIEVTHPTGATDHHQLVLSLHRTASAEADPASFIGVVAAPSGSVHVYEAAGDTLGALAVKYNSGVKLIQKANGMTNTSLRVGRTLNIPLRGPCTNCPVPPPQVVPPRCLPPALPPKS